MPDPQPTIADFRNAVDHFGTNVKFSSRTRRSAKVHLKSQNGYESALTVSILVMLTNA